MRAVECGSTLTVLKVWDFLQDMAIGIERLWATNAAGEIPVRIQDDLGVDEGPGGDSLV